MTYTVQLFHEDQAFGGHEEGGWYFTYGEPVSDKGLGFKVNKRFKSLEKARGYRVRVQALLDRQVNAFRPSQYSVLSKGEYRAYVCNGKPKAYPETKPYYC